MALNLKGGIVKGSKCKKELVSILVERCIKPRTFEKPKKKKKVEAKKKLIFQNADGKVITSFKKKEKIKKAAKDYVEKHPEIFKKPKPLPKRPSSKGNDTNSNEDTEYFSLSSEEEESPIAPLPKKRVKPLPKRYSKHKPGTSEQESALVKSLKPLRTYKLSDLSEDQLQRMKQLIDATPGGSLSIEQFLAFEKLANSKKRLTDEQINNKIGDIIAKSAGKSLKEIVKEQIALIPKEEYQKIISSLGITPEQHYKLVKKALQDSFPKQHTLKSVPKVPQKLLEYNTETPAALQITLSKKLTSGRFEDIVKKKPTTSRGRKMAKTKKKNQALKEQKELKERLDKEYERKLELHREKERLAIEREGPVNTTATTSTKGEGFEIWPGDSERHMVMNVLRQHKALQKPTHGGLKFNPDLNKDLGHIGGDIERVERRGRPRIHPIKEKGGPPRKPNDWVLFLKEYSKHHKISYTDALYLAKDGGLYDAYQEFMS